MMKIRGYFSNALLSCFGWRTGVFSGKKGGDYPCIEAKEVCRAVTVLPRGSFRKGGLSPGSEMGGRKVE